MVKPKHKPFIHSILFGVLSLFASSTISGQHVTDSINDPMSAEQIDLDSLYQISLDSTLELDLEKLIQVASDNSISSEDSLDQVFIDSVMKKPKMNSRPVDPNRMLKAMRYIPIRSWPDSAGLYGMHMGPTARDFKKYFELGDGKTIESANAEGVLIASMKGLIERVRRLEQENNHYRRTQDEMIDVIIRLQNRLGFLERRLGN